MAMLLRLLEGEQLLNRFVMISVVTSDMTAEVTAALGENQIIFNGNFWRDCAMANGAAIAIFTKVGCG